MADESAKAGGILGRLPPWPRNALNNSVIAMEQAYRQRKGLPMLSDADIEALKAGQPMAWESGDGAPAPVAASPGSSGRCCAACRNFCSNTGGWDHGPQRGCGQLGCRGKEME